MRQENHASLLEGIPKTILQGSAGSLPKTLQSQTRRFAENRLSINALAVVHGRLRTQETDPPLPAPMFVGVAPGTCHSPIGDFEMTSLLNFHAFAATRGDGLRPELRALFERVAAAPRSELTLRNDGRIQSGPDPVSAEVARERGNASLFPHAAAREPGDGHENR